MKELHSWNVSLNEVIRIQEKLRSRLILKRTFTEVETVGGGDVAYSKEGHRLYAAVAVLSFPDLETVETATAAGVSSFPYVPGLFGLREGPILIEAFQRLRKRPDAMIFDGQGTAHPRGFGLASHIGLWLNTPSIGCAKTALFGDFVSPGSSRGSHEPIRKDGTEIGAVLRTKENVRPLFVSPGHRIDLLTSIEIVLNACRRFRTPEPLRRAHRAAITLRQHA